MKEVLVERTLRASERYRRRIVERMESDLREREGNCCRCRERSWCLGDVVTGEEASFWVLRGRRVPMVRIGKL